MDMDCRSVRVITKMFGAQCKPTSFISLSARIVSMYCSDVPLSAWPISLFSAWLLSYSTVAVTCDQSTLMSIKICVRGQLLKTSGRHALPSKPVTVSVVPLSRQSSICYLLLFLDSPGFSVKILDKCVSLSYFISQIFIFSNFLYTRLTPHLSQ